jgi:ectoine hydroxylase-related dioxygenase (phytanoyl-CoA dioxygenase family)
LYSHHQNGIFAGAVTDDNFKSAEPVPITLKAGGISIHHARSLHASAPNVSDRPRRLLLFQYCAIDAFPIGSMPDWKTFNANILRGEPIFEARLTPVPVRIPLPTGDRVGSIYEIQTILEKSTLR